MAVASDGEDGHCATLKTDGLRLTPTACAYTGVQPARQRCVIVPTYPPHYHHFRRLLQRTRRFASDAGTVRVIAVLSSDARIELPVLCERGACSTGSAASSASSSLELELTDIHRLMTLDLLTGGGGGHAAKSAAAALHRRLPAARMRATELLQRLEATKESRIRARDLNGRLASTFFHDGFFTSALKKLLGAGLTQCERSWVLDSESAPFRRFSFRRIFDDYWAQPVVYYIPGAADAFFPPREAYLLNASAALLGLPTPRGWGDPRSAHPSARGHVYRVCDYWLWDRRLVRAFMDRARRVAPLDAMQSPTARGAVVAAARGSRARAPRASSLPEQAARTVASLAEAGSTTTPARGQPSVPFVEAFVARPAHELAYYTYLEHVHPRDDPATRHSFVSAKEVRRAPTVYRPPPW